ncbi:MAG: PIN domain-containing protein [Gemmatimonadales bacterium]
MSDRSDRVFVDTNILVYAHDSTAGAKHERSLELVDQLWQDRLGVISTQVLQEFYVNVRRKVRRPLSLSDATQLIEDYVAWEVVANDSGSILEALALERRFQLSFWDALIVRAATEANVELLYSECLSHGQLYGAVRVCNPFLD